MSDFEYIYQQAKKFHFSGWNDEELRKCVDMLPELSRQELFSLYRNKWIEQEKPLKEAIFNQLFKERIGERDRKIKAMTVDELIENLHDENGYGKFIVLEMKKRFVSGSLWPPVKPTMDFSRPSSSSSVATRSQYS